MFIPQQATRSHVIHVPATVDRAFSLFEPLGEKYWAQDWEPEMLYPPSGVAQEGSVFTTQHADEPIKVWTIITYEKEQTHITYINVLPDTYVSRIDVRCTPDANEVAVCVTYTLTALTPQGNEFIDRFTQEQHYRAYISSWQRAIEAYLLHEH
jgi:hypothetical protein